MNATGEAPVSPAHLQILALQLSHNCFSGCRPCVYDCRPNRSRVMQADEAKSIIDQVRTMALTKNFGFSGGEPFLHLNLLHELFRHVKDHFGYKMSISTNAFWAKSETTSKNVLKDLVDLGLWSLLVSVDDFHQEYVDVQNIEHCVRAATDLGVKCFMQCIETRSSRKTEDFKKSLRIPADPELVEWASIPCDPVGRGEREIPSEDLILEWKVRPGICSMLKVWIVDPDGWVSACCGTASSNYLRAGNAFKEPLADIIHRANVNPLFNALAAWGGPLLLMDLLRDQGFPGFAEGVYTGPCHACHTVLGNKEAVEIILPVLESRQLDLVMSRLVAQKQAHQHYQQKGEDNIWLPSPRLF